MSSPIDERSVGSGSLRSSGCSPGCLIVAVVFALLLTALLYSCIPRE